MKGLYQNSRHILCILRLIISSLLSTIPAPAKADSSPTKVWVLSIEAEIDPRMSLYVAEGLREAEAQHAKLVCLQLNTFGGALEDAEKIRNLLIHTPIPVWVLINKNAASAGALIAIACDKIYMAKGSTIGAATVVTGDGEPAPDKYQSYMRSMMRSTAEVSGRNPLLAEGMVGRPLSQDSSKIGHVISYTSSEAIAHGYCEAEVTGLSDMLRLNHINYYNINYYKQNFIDQLIDFFLNPFVKSILMLLIIGGIYFELQAPGIGLPLLTAIIGALLYFIPSYLSGLSENWEIILFFAGLFLLAAELFVIPGFGIAGVSGILCILASLVLVSVNNQFFDFTFVSSADLELLLFLTGISSCLLFVLFFTVGKRILETSYFKKITLQEQESSAQGYQVNAMENLVGQRGKAFTNLRPSGKIWLNGQLYNAYTAGEFIEEQSTVEVREQSMGSLKVRLVKGN